MDELEEGGKLRRLAKDYSRGLIPTDVYRSQRSGIIEAFSQFKTTGNLIELPLQAATEEEMPFEDVYPDAPSLKSVVIVFLLAFVGGLFLGFIIINLDQFPLQCDISWHRCLPAPFDALMSFFVGD